MRNNLGMHFLNLLKIKFIYDCNKKCFDSNSSICVRKTLGVVLWLNDFLKMNTQPTPYLHSLCESLCSTLSRVTILT